MTEKLKATIKKLNVIKRMSPENMEFTGILSDHRPKLGDKKEVVE